MSKKNFLYTFNWTTREFVNTEYIKDHIEEIDQESTDKEINANREKE